MPNSDSSLPELPINLDDLVALDSWYSSWNAWITEEARKRHWPWLKPMTPAMLHEIVESEKRRRSDSIAHGQQQEEMLAARGDLNVLEVHLRATDLQYEAKRRLLVPILQPIFKLIPPSNWKALFEQAYAQIQVPAESSKLDRRRDLADGRNALSAPGDRVKTRDIANEANEALGPRIILMTDFDEIDRAFDAFWEEDRFARADLAREWRSIIPLRWRSECTADEYRVRLSWTKAVLEALFQALHSNTYDQTAEVARYLWEHWQSLDLLSAHDPKRGFSIYKDRLLSAAALYLRHPEIRTNKLDWLFIDTIVFSELDDYAHHVFMARGNTGGPNWAAILANHNPIKYFILNIALWVLGTALSLIAPPALAYFLFVRDYRVGAVITTGVWVLLLALRIVTSPARWRARRKASQLLEHLRELYRILGDITISPRKLKESLDKAVAAGASFDGAVFTIVDRAIARDPTAFIPANPD